MVPPGTQIHSTDLPSGLDTLVAIVGDPGASKTKALKLGQKIMEKPQGLDCPIHLTDMIDGLGISSGPGLIESFMGVDEHGNRVHATHNALFCCDEGSVLKAIGSRNGEILDEVLRCIFAGSDLSTPNATKDRWRHVTDYCVGVVINLQPKSVGLLLSQSGDGSPQRFLWFPATDPNMPESPERCEVPRFPVLREPRQIHFDESIKRAIDRHQFKRARGEVTIDSLEVHLGGWVRAKVSLA